MTEITRTVEQMVADVDVDDDGYVVVHVSEPLTVDEARDVAQAILQAADAGARYLAEEGAEASAPDLLTARVAADRLTTGIAALTRAGKDGTP